MDSQAAFSDGAHTFLLTPYKQTPSGITAASLHDSGAKRCRRPLTFLKAVGTEAVLDPRGAANG